MTERIARKKPPTAGRILAASASVAAGIGLVGLLSTQDQGQELVVQVAPANVVVQTNGSAADSVIVVEAAQPAPAPAPTPAPTPEPVTESAGS